MNEEAEVLEGDVLEDQLAIQVVNRTREITNISERVAIAWDALVNGEIPPSAMSVRKGPADTKIPYIAHWWAKRTINATLGFWYDFEVLAFAINPDMSATTLCKMTFWFPLPNGGMRKKIVTEPGAFEAYPMSKDVTEEYEVPD